MVLCHRQDRRQVGEEEEWVDELANEDFTGGEIPLSLSREEEFIRKTKTTVIAAKYAHQTGMEHWLGLFSRALHMIEQCPAHVQGTLRDSLCAFVVRAS